MTKCVGFAPVAQRDARVLILGTLPGVESLKQQEYYAWKQNSFWRIISDLTGAPANLSYQEKLDNLLKNHIALWDVCAGAEREGSLDTAIKSPVPNDFVWFFKAHPHIERVCFNGQPARKLFFRLVMPALLHQGLRFETLPSTSPAHARLRYEQKFMLWQQSLAAHI